MSVTPRQAINPSYGLLSGRIEFRPQSERWAVALYGTNLLDEVYSSSALAQDFHMGFGNRVIKAYRGRPRSLGISARFNF